MDSIVAFTPPADRVPTTAHHSLRSVTALRSAASTLARSNAPTSVLALRRLHRPALWPSRHLLDPLMSPVCLFHAAKAAHRELLRLARRTRVTRGECAIVTPTLGNTMSTRLIWLPNQYLSSSIVAAATASSKESPFLRDSPARPTQAQRPQCQGRLNLALPRDAARSRRTQRRNGPASLPVVAVWPNIPTRRDKSYSGHLCSKCWR